MSQKMQVSTFSVITLYRRR